MTPAGLPDEDSERTERSERSRRADASADPADLEEIEDDTVLSVRRRGGGAPVAEPEDDAGDDPAEDRTIVSVRRSRPALEAGTDDTAPSARRRGEGDDVDRDDHTVIAARRSVPLPDDVDDTVLSRRPAPAIVETGAETETFAAVEDTLLRPGAPAPAGPAGAGTGDDRATPAEAAVRSRDAYVPDAATLRAPVPPRAVPTIAAVRSSAPSPSSLPDRTASPPDHESVERADRGQGRRRVLIVVVSAIAVALASAVALVLLLT